MKTRAFGVFGTIISIPILAQFSPAQITAFSYQGRLLDTGQPVNGAYDFQFRLYDAPSGGNQVPVVPISPNVTVSNGLFTTGMDFGLNVFNGSVYWLEIAVQPHNGVTFTTLTPRQEILPVPGAIFATSASNLLGTLAATQLNGTVAVSSLPPSPNFSGTVSATDFSGTGANLTSLNADNIASGTLGDARLSTNVALRAGGNTFTEPQIYNGPIYLNATDGFDQSAVGNFLVDAAYLPGGRFAVLTNGNVGINNPDPQYTLDVNGPMNLPAPATVYSSGVWLLRADQYGNFFAGLLAGNLNRSNYYNVGIGYGALFNDVSAANNTAIGAYSLVSNTAGTNNTASGYQSLYSNTNGSYNTANGYQALYSNLAGAANVADGAQALYSNTGGKENTASGFETMYSNTTGSDNTAGGIVALYSNTTGRDNTANGAAALYSNTNGSGNTAVGRGALYSNSTGSQNTASGYQALYSNVAGNNNTANGYEALYASTNSQANTANGYQALYSNANGHNNTATGFHALYGNISGFFNTADGDSALFYNTSGRDNTGIGVGALADNTIGSANTAVGSQALPADTEGNYNTAVGYLSLQDAEGIYPDMINYNTAVGSQTLYFTRNGEYNIALGFQAGYYINGSSNIDIGSQGVSGDANFIRIGAGQTETFIAGIYGTTASGGIPVYVNSAGQLGTISSSQRFKQNIQTMGDASDVLLSLQPVTFQYKPDIDPHGLAQYGLIAEQVEKVDPDLVVHDQEHGIYTVRYEAVNAMLLNEFLKQHKTVVEENARIQQLEQTVTELKRKEAESDDLNRRLAQLEQLVNDQIGGTK